MNDRRLAYRSPLPHAQRGATLIVGLVLLLVLTVVGVSGMNTATMEINMAANTQFQQDAFQVAEDGIDVMLANRDYTDAGARTLDWSGNPDIDRRAVTAPPAAPAQRRTDVPDAVWSVGAVEAFHFDITSVGRGPRNAQSQQTQSFYVVGRALAF